MSIVKQLFLMPKDMKGRLKVLRKKLGVSQQHVMREGVEIALQKYEKLLAGYEAEKE